MTRYLVILVICSLYFCSFAFANEVMMATDEDLDKFDMLLNVNSARQNMKQVLRKVKVRNERAAGSIANSISSEAKTIQKKSKKIKVKKVKPPGKAYGKTGELPPGLQKQDKLKEKIDFLKDKFKKKKPTNTFKKPW